MDHTPFTWNAIDTLFGSALLESDAALEAALASSAAANLPAIAVSPLQGRLLHLIARIHHARHILEIGTLGGYSAICMARALPRDGRLISLEIDPTCARVARANIAAAGLAEIAEVRLGAALELLPGLAAEGWDRGAVTHSFDLVFIDADKPSNPDYFNWALRLTRPGGIIIVDNVVRDGEVADATSTNPGVLGVRRLLDLVHHEPRVTATAIQTVGVKGYDGFLIAVVK